jgi:nitroreductase
MQKPAAVDAPIQDLLRHRWSPRAFADKLVPADVLRSLFEAARWAPSSGNAQPWVYFVGTKDDPENFAKMLGILLEGNAAWAKHAPVIALSLARVNRDDGKPNRSAFHDVGSATAQLTFEANSRGLWVHQMGGYSAEKAKQMLNLPADVEPVAAMAIGYPGDPESLPENMREREMAARTRKPTRDFVMSGTWGHTAPFLTS